MTSIPKPTTRLGRSASATPVRDISRGLRFDRNYHAAVARIAADPTSLSPHPEATRPEVRFKTIVGFPYYVLFRTSDADETRVLGVLHTAAGPAQFRRAERRG